MHRILIHDFYKNSSILVYNMFQHFTYVTCYLKKNWWLIQSSSGAKRDHATLEAIQSGECFF